MSLPSTTKEFILDVLFVDLPLTMGLDDRGADWVGSVIDRMYLKTLMIIEHHDGDSGYLAETMAEIFIKLVRCLKGGTSEQSRMEWCAGALIRCCEEAGLTLKEAPDSEDYLWQRFYFDLKQHLPIDGNDRRAMLSIACFVKRYFKCQVG